MEKSKYHPHDNHRTTTLHRPRLNASKQVRVLRHLRESTGLLHTIPQGRMLEGES